MLLALLACQSPADTAGAYLDAGARDLVRRARERRTTSAAAVTEYHAVVRERISLGLRALRRDRVLYRREMAGRVAWRRDGPDSITMLGAREAIPIAFSRVQLPEDLHTDAPDLAFDPRDDRIMIGDGDSGFVYHPLAPGSEANYRFQSGDTTTIMLAGGKTLRLAELRVIPRRDEFRLMAGTLWIDLASDEVVRLVFRPARAFDLERDLDPKERGDTKGLPGFLKPIRAEVRYMTVEYALWEDRWWLPRLIALDAVATAGTIINAPLRYEREYSDMEVRGDTTPEALVRVSAAPPPRRHRHHHRRRGDSTAVADSGADSTGAADDFAVVLPPDSLSLLTSPIFPAPLLGDDESVLGESDARSLAAELRLLPRQPWQAHAPRLAFGLGGNGLLRYNRVEALSVGARYESDFGRLGVDLTGRLGVADLQPNAELGLGWETTDLRLRFAGYRRLAAANPATRALGIGNSLSALFLGRDDGAYYRAAGLEFVVQPAAASPQTFSWRLWAERQRPVVKETDASLAHLLNAGHRFPGNIAAAPADVVGAALTLHGEHGRDPAGIRVGADLDMDAGVGTYGFARIALTTRLTVPLFGAGRLIGGLEAAGGAAGGEVPVQEYWYLGGPATLRGYGGLAAAGESFWRARMEVANAFPAARVALFSDAGWAGPGRAMADGRPLVAVGAGASFFDGLLRVDLARALRAPTGWRLDCYVDGIL